MRHSLTISIFIGLSKYLASHLRVTVILFFLLPGSLLAAPGPAFKGDHKSLGDDFDLFRSEKKVQVIEKTIRIQREKIHSIKSIPLRTYMRSIYDDGRLSKYVEILTNVEKRDADSCPACWSVFNKLLSGANAVLVKAEKAKRRAEARRDKINGKDHNTEDKGEDNKEDPVKIGIDESEQHNKPRDPSLAVIENSRTLFLGLASSKESSLIYDAAQIFYDELNSPDNKTVAEQSYFSTVAHYMIKPFRELLEEEMEDDLE